MEKHEAEASPRGLARIGGVLYLVTILVGLFDELVIKGTIVVPGDAAATAANLRSMETLWRLGIVGEMVMILCTIPFALILYRLLKPAGRHLALLATFFGLAAVTVETAYSLQLIEALFPLGNAAYLKAFTPEQLNAMASLSLKSHLFGFGIALLLFGPFFLTAGYVIFKSGYFPKAIGVLYQIAGVAYMANSFMLILAPRFAGQMWVAMLLPAFIGETSFCVYLLVKGVNMEKWKGWA